MKIKTPAYERNSREFLATTLWSGYVWNPCWNVSSSVGGVARGKEDGEPVLSTTFGIGLLSAGFNIYNLEKNQCHTNTHIQPRKLRLLLGQPLSNMVFQIWFPVSCEMFSKQTLINNYWRTKDKEPPPHWRGLKVTPSTGLCLHPRPLSPECHSSISTSTRILVGKWNSIPLQLNSTPPLLYLSNLILLSPLPL